MEGCPLEDKNDIRTYSLQTVQMILYYFLINEWLLSLLQITNTLRIDGFQLFIAGMLIFYFWFKQTWIHVLGGISGALLVIYHLYYIEPLFSFTWIKDLWKEVLINITFLLDFQWSEVSNQFRSLLFLLALWMMIKLLALFIHHHKSFLIILITAAYLSIIDSFFLYDAAWPIVRIISIGLVIIALEQQKWILSETENSRLSFRFITAALILSLAIITVGYFSPKAEAKWADPTGWFDQFQGKGMVKKGKDSIKKIGYSVDDSFLGGPFEQDDIVVMESISNKRVYWRGESKDTYTGHGWVNSRDTHYEDWVMINGKEVYDFPVHLMKKDAPLEKQELKYSLSFATNNTFNLFFLGGDWEEIHVMEADDVVKAKVNRYNQNLLVHQQLGSYQVTGYTPIIDEKILRQTNEDYSKVLLQTYLASYLALPDNLPQRVRDLANELTKENDNPYDKAQAIKSYVRTHYRYDTENVPYPKENEDFVDQFLFESQIGYCDHFSSSMVVLVRSIGIPARWVKGFTPGETSYDSEIGEYKGLIQNKNAHSWVEVYFNNIGWIPFEATPSFQMSLEYKIDQDLTAMDRLDNLPQRQLKEELELDDLKDGGMSKQSSTYLNLFQWISFFLIMLLTILFVKYRTEISFWWRKHRLSKEKSMTRMIILSTEHFLAILGTLGKEKESAQTVREYLSSLFQSSSTNEWEEVTEVYEEARYSQRAISEQWRKKFWDYWKQLIIRIRS